MSPNLALIGAGFGFIVFYLINIIATLIGMHYNTRGCGEEIMGMAGCLEDTPGWMQIGVDVIPKFCSKGIGT